MRTIRSLFLLFILFASCGITVAKTLFWDDFEGSLHGDYEVISTGGNATWQLDVLDGNGVYKAESPAGVASCAVVDDVASLKQYPEIWATVKFQSEGNSDSCAELGLLIDPKILNGNWFFATCEGGAEVGIDESWVAWHNRVPYQWQLSQWYTMKILVTDKILHGKIWAEGEDEPSDWMTQETLTSHLDEDGVGLCNWQQVTFFDDLIVADSEDSLTMAVNSRGKLASKWATIKRTEFGVRIETWNGILMDVILQLY